MRFKIIQKYGYRKARINNGTQLPADVVPLLIEHLNNHETAMVNIRTQLGSSTIAVQLSDNYVYIGKTSDIEERPW
ncbi:MAG: hypothetical protein ACOC2W_00215 [bacterium]